MLTDYRFSNPRIERIPPPRELYPVNYSGISSLGIPFTFNLQSITVSNFRGGLNHIAVPKRLGNWTLMNEWIGNMWEALYNPIWLWLYKDKYYIVHGNHRFRLLDAMGAERIYAYIQVNDGDTYKIGAVNLDAENEANRLANERPPKIGNVRGVCVKCGEKTRWVRKTFNVVSDVRLYCKACGAENPYPWRGQI